MLINALADLNVLDWSQRDQLTVALGNVVYVYTVGTSSINELCSTEEQNCFPTALQWNAAGDKIAVGTSNADVQVK